MEYVLKVSPKGQVILPKKLRESLQVKELVAIEVKDHTGIVKKPILSSDKPGRLFQGLCFPEKDLVPRGRRESHGDSCP